MKTATIHVLNAALNAVCVLMCSFIVCAILFDLRLILVCRTSMEPTLADGSFHLARRIDPLDEDSIPQPGSIVTFYTDYDHQTLYVKRLIAHAGDRVACADGKLYVNGEFFDAIPGTGMSGTNDIDWETTVEDGCFFALGDNRSVSRDSRSMGFFPYELLYSEIIF